MKDKLPSQAISWLGILGGALTIVGNLESVLTLSDWVRLLVSNWTTWTTNVWSGLLAIFGADAPGDSVLAWWTVSFFILAISVGARLTGRQPGKLSMLFSLAFTRIHAELFVLVFALVGMLVLPTYSGRLEGWGTVLLVLVPYTLAVTLAQLITTTEQLVKRLRIVVLVVLMALVLNWISMLVAAWVY